MRHGIARILLPIAVLTTLALLVAAILPFVKDLPPAEGTVPPMRLAAGGEYALAEGVRVYYQAQGESNPALVLLHGFGASSSSWRQVGAHFSTRNRVLAFDRPGFGLTVRPMPPYEGANPYNLDAAADQTLALLDYLAVGKTVLVAHSAGAAVALEVAARHPERVDGVLLEAPAIEAAGHSRPEFTRTLMRSPWGRFYGPLLLRRTFPRSGERLLERSFARPDRLTPELKAQYLLPLQTQDWDRALWEVMAAPGAQVPSRLDEISVPVTVVYGAQDTIVSPEDSRRVAEEIPGAQVVEIPDAGHIPHEEQPDAFNAALEALLRRIAEGKS